MPVVHDTFLARRPKPHVGAKALKKCRVDDKKHTNHAGIISVKAVSASSVCKHFLSEKGCSRGEKCRFLHETTLTTKRKIDSVA